MRDVTSFLRLGDVDSSELQALIFSQFSTSSHNQNVETGGPHVVNYGNSELRLTYKSKTDNIRKIEVSDTFSRVHLNSLQDKVTRYLIQREGQLEYPSTTLFSFGKSSIGFKYEDKFQLFSTPCESPYPDEDWAEFPIVLQFSYIKTGNVILDSIRSSRARNEISFLLTGVFPTIFGFLLANTIPPNSKKCWVYPNSAQSEFLPSEWCQVGYSTPKIQSDSFLELRQSQLLGEANRKLESTFNDFYRLDDSSRKSIISACYWFHKAIIANNKTDTFLNLIIMIESLSPNKSECECGEIVSHKENQCPNCGKCFNGVTKSFTNFVKEYARIDDDRFIKSLYNFRSNITHSGLTLNAEGNGFQFGFIPISILESQASDSLINICSTIIRNYITNKAQS